MKIAIDGPAGAGKSTIARIVAQRLGYVYVDTGAMYRALTLTVLTGKGNPDDESSVMSFFESMELQLLAHEEGMRILVDGEDVTERIRTPFVSLAVSQVSAHPLVREQMVLIQRSVANKGQVVMDGRDIGTTVMPGADLKIFLQASVEVRAHRRSLELAKKGLQADLTQVREEILQRDLLDSTRLVSPLKKAWDAVEVDATDKTIEEVVQEVIHLARRRQVHV